MSMYCAVASIPLSAAAFRRISRRLGWVLSLVSLTACGSPADRSIPSSNLNSPEKTEAIAPVLEFSTMQSDLEPVRVGILAIDSALSVHRRYDPLMSYLSETLNRPFELVTLTQESQFTTVSAADIDFTTNNPLAAVQIQRLYDTEFLVTHVRPNSGPAFSGLIIVKSDSSIQTLQDLRGKRVACVDVETAAAGCLFQVYHVLQSGIDPFKDFSEFIENPSQDSIVFGVLNGVIDAGFIRTGQLEKMVKNGLLPNTDDIRVLDEANDGFVYAHTTVLYPEWPIAALKDTDPDLAEAVEEALLAIPANHPALAAANVTGFVDAVDYQSITDLIETLQLKSWDTD